MQQMTQMQWCPSCTMPVFTFFVTLSWIKVIPYHKAMSDQAVMQAFSMSLEEVCHIISVANLDMPWHRWNIERTNNHSTQWMMHVDHIRPNGCQLPAIQQALIENAQIQPAPHSRGPDVEHFAQHRGGTRDAMALIAQPAAQQDLTRRVQVLLEQFFHDTLMESPNKKAVIQGAWTNIPKVLCPMKATKHLYQTSALPFFAA